MALERISALRAKERSLVIWGILITFPWMVCVESGRWSDSGCILPGIIEDRQNKFDIARPWLEITAAVTVDGMLALENVGHFRIDCVRQVFMPCLIFTEGIHIKSFCHESADPFNTLPLMSFLQPHTISVIFLLTQSLSFTVPLFSLCFFDFFSSESPVPLSSTPQILLYPPFLSHAIHLSELGSIFKKGRERGAERMGTRKEDIDHEAANLTVRLGPLTGLSRLFKLQAFSQSLNSSTQSSPPGTCRDPPKFPP